MSSEEKQIRIGIIGAGQISKAHQLNYSKIPGAKMVAIVDIIEEKARQAADEYQIPHVYTDFREMLQRDDIDAVDVCLHNNLHMPATVAALESGRHVYCEKPMAGSYRDAATMLSTARSLNLKLSIQLALLYTNDTRVAKLMIEDGMLGEPFHARSTGFRRRGRPYVDGYGTEKFVQKSVAAGGALYDMGVYHISQLLYLLNNPTVTRITGKAYQKTDIDPRRRELSGYNVEELGLGFVRFDSDLTLDIIEAWAIHLDGLESSSIVGSKGGIRLNPFGYYHNIGDIEVNSMINAGAAATRWNSVHEDGGHFSSPQQHWIAALQGKVDLLPTAEIALNTMLISEGIYLSHQQGREVTAEEVIAESKSTAVAM